MVSFILSIALTRITGGFDDAAALAEATVTAGAINTAGTALVAEGIGWAIDSTDITLLPLVTFAAFELVCLLF